MSTMLEEKKTQSNEAWPQAEPKKVKKTRGKTLPLVLLILFVILLILTTIVLGSRLYRLSSRDRYVVDLGVGLGGEIELFKIEYSNASGEVTVVGTNGQNVVAPGTTVEYGIRLRNRDDVAIDFVMAPQVDYATEDPVPLRVKLMDSYGNYLLGSESHWADVEALNGLYHKGAIHPGEVFTYTLIWQWPFELGGDEDVYDTYLGNAADGNSAPGVEVGFYAEAAMGPATIKHGFSMSHLMGEGFGCCWCCYLVWILLVIAVLLLLWVCQLRRKLHQRERELEECSDRLKEYEEVLTAAGFMEDGRLKREEYAGI